MAPTSHVYPIDPQLTLREVYLYWLIAIDSNRFLEENGLTSEQAFAFRTIDNIRWQDFLEERSKS